MNKPLLLVSAIVLSLSGCNTIQQGTSLTPIAAQNKIDKTQNSFDKTENDKMSELLESYFIESLIIFPVTGTYLGESRYNDKFSLPLHESKLKLEQLNDRYFSAISSIDRDKLDAQGKLSFDIIFRDFTLDLKSRTFKSHLLPINQMDGMQNELAAFGSGESAQPFETVQDYDAFLQRAKGFKAWANSLQQVLNEGIQEGITLPKVIAAKIIPQFAAHVVYNPEDSVFWLPIKNMPKTFNDEDITRLTDSYREVIMLDIIPTYRDMAEYLEEVYLPNCRDTVGYSALPNGDKWYQNEIHRHTTLNLTANEIHEIGLKEVSRIRSEMTKVKEQVGFEGDLDAFFVHLRESDEFYFESSEELVSAYENVKKNIDSRLHLLFNISPKADYVVKPVEAFRQQSAPGASYQGPSADGSKPGVFYINTYNLKAQPKFIVETLSIHEAAPGHHFQIALQQEIDALPTFRKFGGYTVFAEGWALYAESLGKELGLFTDPYQWYGRLVDEQLRAMRLVVDSGLHAKGWTREQAIEFMLKNSSMAESDVIAEVERYIAWPGQALSYKLGQFKIRELRDYASAQLGKKFDVKEFHKQILIDGAMPMDILEKKIKAWVKSQLI